MLERRVLGAIAPRPHTVYAHQQKNTHEYVFTRDGFSGGFSILYMQQAPTALKKVELAKLDARLLLGEPISGENLSNARRHFLAGKTPNATDYVAARVALFRNQSCRISHINFSASKSPYGFCNGDADELYFFKSGHGHVLSMFGKLAFSPGDYILIPRGISYIIAPSSSGYEALCTEGDPCIEIPSDFKNPHGQLKLEAPYTHRDFHSPFELLSKEEADLFCKTITLRNGTLTEHIYEISPAQTIGWDGSVYPMRFHISDYLPKTGKIHLPPNLHLTFKAKDFVVCSFVPRMVDYAEGAIPCPYPHANAECDEILYYVSGDFTSRSGIGEKSITFHPAGLPHGPQPGKYFGSVGSKYTNELAIMIDTWKPLQVTKACLELEDTSYQTSWIR